MRVGGNSMLMVLVEEALVGTGGRAKGLRTDFVGKKMAVDMCL